MIDNKNKDILLDSIDKVINAGQLEEAKDATIECLKVNVLDLDFLATLADIEFLQGNHFKAKYILSEAYKINQSSDIQNMIDMLEQEIQKKNTKENLITVSFIVKDEEKTLARAINSIRNIADEIIVVDTGSSDKTVEIAKELGAKVYFFDWINDYSAARNISIKYATSKWILYLDADEVLTEYSASIIRDLANNADDNLGAYICTISNDSYSDDNQFETYSGLYPRFFRNLGYPILHFFGKVHEQISPSFLDRGYTYSNSQLEIRHYGYAVTKDEMQKKITKHIKVLTEDIQLQPDNGYTWYQLGNTLYQVNKSIANKERYIECKEVLENALKCGNLSQFLNANTALLISKIYEELDDLHSAFKYAHKSLEYSPNYKEALQRKAELLMKMGKLDDILRK